MKLLFAVTALLTALSMQAQVGIGTNSPNPASALEVSSTNKGILLPRLNDTTNVSGPTEGLFIYNKGTKAPAYYNGTQWNTLANRATAITSPGDSVTYTITNGSVGVGYINGTFAAQSLSNGITYNAGTGKASFADIAFIKGLDANSIAFTSAISSSTTGGTPMTIEFKVFTAGATTPNYSIKLTAPRINSYQVGIVGGQLTESISISGRIYGYRNWIAGTSTAWDLATNQVVPY